MEHCKTFYFWNVDADYVAQVDALLDALATCDEKPAVPETLAGPWAATIEVFVHIFWDVRGSQDVLSAVEGHDSYATFKALLDAADKYSKWRAAKTLQLNTEDDDPEADHAEADDDSTSSLRSLDEIPVGEAADEVWPGMRHYPRYWGGGWA